ncbi:MAG: signal peptidase II [Bacillota bacterium]
MVPIALTVVLLDRLTKVAVVSRMRLGESLEVVPSLFYITRAFNTGAAFGIMAGRTGLFAVVALVVILLVFRISAGMDRSDRLMNAALGLVLGGAAGNLYDRLRFGGVVDFIDIKVWPAVFNIADAAIVCGVVLFALGVYRRAS